jgi:uncharacterized OB-fold protein
MSFTGNEFFTHLAERRLMGSRCDACGKLYLPPRPICGACHSTAMHWYQFSGQGTLAAFTTIHIGSTAMIEAGYGRDKPYCTGIVALEEGPSISAQILGVDPTHPEQIAIGTPLQMSFIERKRGEETRAYLAFERV